ncbi:MCE family protein [Nocardioides daejeonensis]|uniref:MCE family protein n=1 Tax=Nocardioides daejeonensis TaxID=1046556 RepID=UPI000D742F01|nr:MCE family protein [Nocardioides daejeonensis]
MKRLIIPGIIVVLLAVAAFTMFRSEDRKYLTASFDRTVAVYEGSEVRILGVRVGEVESVEPAGTSVKVKLWYDADINLPADAQAVIVTPNVVGDRFVQLTPVYTGGDTLPDNATLTMEDTSSPLELDEIYESIDTLVVALGPDGANSEGALSELLQVGADNLEGQGEEINRTLKDLGRFTGTLENNKEELFGAAEELQRFISTLADNDQLVRDFNHSIASVSEMLAGERQELAASLQNLGGALGSVRDFVKDNEELLGKNIRGLDKVAKVLVKRRAELDEILTAGPVALNNLALTYNPQAGTLDVSANLENAGHVLATNPSLFLCSVVGTADPTGVVCNLLDALLGKKRAATSADEPVEPTLAAAMGVAR